MEYKFGIKEMNPVNTLPIAKQFSAANAVIIIIITSTATNIIIGNKHDNWRQTS